MALRIFFALLTLAILGLAIGSGFYIFQKVEKPKVEAVREIRSSAPPKPIDPGVTEFKAAMALVKNRQLVAARDKLRYIIRYFPQSERHQLARELCTQVNLDLLMSPNFSQSKTSYEVVRGDSLSKIAAAHDTTIEYIQRVNGMMDFSISPGDQLVVRPLAFQVTINAKRQTVTLSEDGEFFAEYPIAKLAWPPGVVPPFDDVVRSVAARLGASTVTSTQVGYDRAAKEIHLKRPQLKILSPVEHDDQEPMVGPGIFMDPADVEELTMLLRSNTPIHVL